MHQHLVDHHLGKQRRDQADQLDEGRDQQDFRQDMPEALDDRQEPGEAETQRVAAERFPLGDEDDAPIPGLLEIRSFDLGHGLARTGNQHASLGHFRNDEEFARPVHADRRQRHPLQALGRGTAAPRPVTFAARDAQQIVGGSGAAGLQIFMTQLGRIETLAKDGGQQAKRLDAAVCRLIVIRCRFGGLRITQAHLQNRTPQPRHVSGTNTPETRGSMSQSSGAGDSSAIPAEPTGLQPPLVIASSPCDEAIQSVASGLLSSTGGAEPVIGRAFARPVGADRWLAMTVAGCTHARKRLPRR